MGKFAPALVALAVSFNFISSAAQPIIVDELKEWDGIAASLCEKQTADQYGWKSRTFSYLYGAQSDFVNLLQERTGKRDGSIAPISAGILTLFFPDYPAPKDSDPLSNTIAAEVLEKYRQRFEKENSQIKPYPEHTNPDAWHGTPPYYGLSVGSLMPWFQKDNKPQLCKPPESLELSYWQQQLEQMKQAMKGLTPQRKEMILFWAGLSGPGSGDWLTIADQYMDQVNTPLGKRLAIRSELAKGIYDAFICCFASKYTYWIKRPFMIDPTLKTVIETPNHPSYPAGHSTISKLAAELLSDHFPEGQTQFAYLAEQCGMSRIWAGIHFPADHESGTQLGKAVADQVRSHR